jgi:ComF family protein
VGLHAGTLRSAILNYKFENRRRLAEPLGGLLAGRFAREAEESEGLPWQRVDCLVPVPLHPRRRSWRGFDQSLLLAQEMSRHTGLPVVSDGLVRVRPTTPQVELSTRERHENVRRAFAPLGEVLRGRNLLLVDDVYTTGATLSEVARAAREAGAASVYALTISRPPPAWHPAAFALEPGRD